MRVFETKKTIHYTKCLAYSYTTRGISRQEIDHSPGAQDLAEPSQSQFAILTPYHNQAPLQRADFTKQFPTITLALSSLTLHYLQASPIPFPFTHTHSPSLSLTLPTLSLALL